LRLVISARHTSLTDPVKAYAREKVGRLEKFIDNVTKAELVLCPGLHGGPHGRREDSAPADGAAGGEQLEDGSGGVAVAELVVSVAREHAPFVAHAKGESFHAAVDLVADKMERQLRRYKGKLRDRHRQAK
jgi:putative sigma-54 modulation protein